MAAVTDGSGNAISDSSNIANLNPYRYRGYYYDTETGLYYLQSRYYNPEMGRFLNADSVAGKIGEIGSHNLFAYCCNDPINSEDDNGQGLISWAKKKWAAAKSAAHRVYTAVANTCQRVVNGAKRLCSRAVAKCKKAYQSIKSHFCNRSSHHSSPHHVGHSSSHHGNSLSKTLGGFATANTAMKTVPSCIACLSDVAETVSKISGPVAVYGYAFTTPFSIASHLVDPDMSDLEKGVSVSADLLIAAGGIALAVSGPVGWIGVGVTVAYAFTTTWASDNLTSYYENN